MDRLTKTRSDGMQLAKSDRFRDGLRQAFAVGQEPLPSKMEKLLQRLVKDDDSAPEENHAAR